MSARETTEEAVSRIAGELQAQVGDHQSLSDEYRSIRAAIRQAIAVGIREAADLFANEFKIHPTLVNLVLERRLEEIEHGAPLPQEAIEALKKRGLSQRLGN